MPDTRSQDSVYIIAEAGVNHNGDVSKARRLIEIAAEAGANAVKFQTFTADKLVTRKATTAAYQMETTGEKLQLDMLKKLELKSSDYLELFKYAKKFQIDFVSTAFDVDSLFMLNELGVPFFKIPSGEITHYQLIKNIALIGKPVVLSTGMATISEIQDCINVLLEHGMLEKNISVLHCNTQYPTPFCDVNLRAMSAISSLFPLVKVGYSDHTLGIEVPIAAVALGAVVIEKHFTMDRSLPGPDHLTSLEPAQLKAMVESIRNIEQALGSGKKCPSESELKNKLIVRKSLVASRDIATGDLFEESNLTAKRPGSGLSPMLWPEIVGIRAARNYSADDLIEM